MKVLTALHLNGKVETLDLNLRLAFTDNTDVTALVRAIKESATKLIKLTITAEQ